MLKKLVGGILITTFIFGQTTANPQFSVIGDLVIDHLNKNTSLLSSGIEMAIQGYVNPFARADIYLHKHNDTSPIELEEAVMTIEKGLPFGLAHLEQHLLDSLAFLGVRDLFGRIEF